jgi:hypothetical protein
VLPPFGNAWLPGLPPVNRTLRSKNGARASCGGFFPHGLTTARDAGDVGVQASRVFEIFEDSDESVPAPAPASPERHMLRQTRGCGTRRLAISAERSGHAASTAAFRSKPA